MNVHLPKLVKASMSGSVLAFPNTTSSTKKLWKSKSGFPQISYRNEIAVSITRIHNSLQLDENKMDARFLIVHEAETQTLKSFRE